MGKMMKKIGRRQLQQKVDEFKRLCRRMGLRVTPQRMAIYELLVQSKEHPSAETVYREVRQVMPNISLDTVNRTLLTLSDIGAAFIVEGSGDVRRYDADQNNHQHFKCVKCKRIVDFHCREFDNISVPREIGRKFTILRKAVYFEGICDVCRKNKT